MAGPSSSLRSEDAQRRPGPAARVFRFVTRTAAIVAMLGLFLIALVTVADVLLRWLLSAPMHGATDVAGTAIMLVAAASFVSGASYKAHISLPVAGLLLGRRGARFFDTVGAVVLAGFIAAIAYHLWLHSNEMLEENRQLSVLEWPLAPWWYAATVLMWICAAAHVLELFLPKEDQDRAA